MLLRSAGRLYAGVIGARTIVGRVTAADETLLNARVVRAERPRAGVTIVRAVGGCLAAGGINHNAADVVYAGRGGAWIAVVDAGEFIRATSRDEAQAAALALAYGLRTRVVVVRAIRGTRAAIG